MSSQIIIGPFFPENQSKGIVHLSLSHPVTDFKNDFRRFNLVANYLAEYTSYFFQQKDKAENLVSTICYEMLESMSNFSREGSFLGINFITLEKDIVLELCLTCDTGKIESLKEILKKINGKDLESEYLCLLGTETYDSGSSNHFGLIMIAHDYRASIGLSIDTENYSSCLRVRLDQKEITT